MNSAAVRDKVSVSHKVDFFYEAAVYLVHYFLCAVMSLFSDAFEVAINRVRMLMELQRYFLLCVAFAH